MKILAEAEDDVRYGRTAPTNDTSMTSEILYNNNIADYVKMSIM